MPYVVKNTFVNIDDGEREGPGKATASMPVMRLKPYQRPELSQPRSPEESSQNFLVRPAMPQHVQRGGPAVDIVHEEEPDHIGFVPLAVREPEESEGCIEHGTGRCRPCAWYWKEKGCVNGRRCRHCHLCPEFELKNRKKDKIAVMRSNAPPRG